jgi:predicted DCC family thiol-disulfide oxidoreductase YuxK
MERSDSTPDPLVLYDGHCRLCASSVQFVIRRDRAGTFHFLDSVGPRARVVSTARIRSQHAGELHGDERGRAFIRSDATFEVLRRCGGFWACVAWLRWIPRFVADPVYNLVARNRYRWFGRAETCLVPTREIRARFIA